MVALGVHAWFRLKALAAKNGGAGGGVADQAWVVAWADTDWVEACYGCLSWTAKLYVFWTAFAMRYDEEKGTDTLRPVFYGGGFVVLVALGGLVVSSPVLSERVDAFGKKLFCCKASARPFMPLY